MKYLLLTTTRCPKCPEVKAWVSENISFPGEILDETHENFLSQVQALSIAAAPAFILFNDQEEELFRGSEISEIQDFLASQ